MKSMAGYFVVFVMLISGCSSMSVLSPATPTPTAEPLLPEDLPINNDYFSLLQKTVPDHVDGVIVKGLTRIGPVWHRNELGELTSIDDAYFRLLIRVNGVEDVYPVTFETFDQTWWAEEKPIKLDCTVRPCQLEK